MDATLWHSLATEDRPPLPPCPEGLLSKDPSLREAAIDQLEIDLLPTVLPHPAATDLSRRLTSLVRANAVRPAGSKTIAGVTAAFAAGKSTSVTHWAFGFYREEIAGVADPSYPVWEPEPGIRARLVPVVYLSLMSSAGVKELNAQILAFLGYPGEGVTRVTSARVITALRRHGVRVLIVDDVHMLRLTDRSSRLVLDYLKTLNSELGFLHGTILFVGPNLESTPIFDDPQIRARLRLFNIDPFEIESDEGRREWQEFLKGCESLLGQYLPKAAPGVLSSQQSAFIWFRCQGFVGDAATLLSGALISVLRRGGRTITREDLLDVPLSARAEDAQAELERRVRRKNT